MRPLRRAAVKTLFICWTIFAGAPVWAQTDALNDSPNAQSAASFAQNEVPTAPSEPPVREQKVATFDFRSGVFIQRALNRFVSEHPEMPLFIDAPSRFRMAKFLGYEGEHHTEEFIWVGMLHRLVYGLPFFRSADDFVFETADYDFEAAQAWPESTTAPAEHKALLLWILAQPDRSITPDALLAKSLEITNGHVFKALLIGWDLLSSGWSSRQRGTYPRTLKLAEIPHVKNDLFPSWYHFWGTMSYSYFVSARTRGVVLLPTVMGSIWVFGEELIGLKSRNIENAIQRAEIDMAGVLAGEHLYRASRLKDKNPAKFQAWLKADTGQPYITPRSISVKAFIAEVRAKIRRFKFVALEKLPAWFFAHPPSSGSSKGSSSNQSLTCEGIFL